MGLYSSDFLGVFALGVRDLPLGFLTETGLSFVKGDFSIDMLCKDKFAEVAGLFFELLTGELDLLLTMGVLLLDPMGVADSFKCVFSLGVADFGLLVGEADSGLTFNLGETDASFMVIFLDAGDFTFGDLPLGVLLDDAVPGVGTFLADLGIVLLGDADGDFPLGVITGVT